MTSWSTNSVLKPLVFLLGLVIAFLAVDFRIAWLINLEFPVSTDGYFYLKELAHRREYGVGYYTSYSPFFWILGSLSRLFSLSELIVFNSTVIISLLVFVGSLAIPVVRAGHWSFAPLLIAAVFSSDLLFFRHYGFPQQSLGAAIVLLGTSIILCSKARSPQIITLSLTLALIGATFHLFAAALFLLLWTALAIRYLSSFALRLALVLTSFIAVAGLVYLADRPILTLEALQWRTSWQLFCVNRGCSRSEWIEFVSITAACISLILLALIPHGRLQQKSFPLLLALAAILLFSPIWSNTGNMNERLAFGAVWLGWFSALVLLCAAPGISLARFDSLPALILGLGLLVANFSERRLPQVSLIEPAILQENRHTINSWLGPTPLIVAPHGIQFQLTYFLAVPAQNSYPKNETDQQLYYLSSVKRPKKSCVSVQDIELSDNCARIPPLWQLKRVRK